MLNNPLQVTESFSTSLHLCGWKVSLFYQHVKLSEALMNKKESNKCQVIFLMFPYAKHVYAKLM